MPSPILAATLSASKERKEIDKSTPEDIALLKEYGLLNDKSGIHAGNWAMLTKLSSTSGTWVTLEGSKLVSCPDPAVSGTQDPPVTATPSVQSESSSAGGEKQKEKEISSLLNESDIKTLSSFENLITKTAFQLDQAKIQQQLEAFLSGIPKEEEGYLPEEVEIFYFMELNTIPEKLIGAGTKVLDALLYCALCNEEKSKGIFKITKVEVMNPGTVSRNITRSHSAILAGTTLVFIHGSLPMNRGNETRPVPKFIKSTIYHDNINSLTDVGKDLSSASTKKFPARIFLNVDLNILPPAVSSRCKLSIAGNKGIRYAVYAAFAEKKSPKALHEKATPEEIMKIMEENAKLKQAMEIVDFLKGLEGNHLAQIKLHPLKPERPVVKNLTLKMTRAIIETLSSNGRLQLAAKIDNSKNAAFMIDQGYYGVDVNGFRSWPILENSDADYKELSVPALKTYYGIS